MSQTHHLHSNSGATNIHREIRGRTKPPFFTLSYIPSAQWPLNNQSIAPLRSTGTFLLNSPRSSSPPFFSLICLSFRMFPSLSSCVIFSFSPSLSSWVIFTFSNESACWCICYVSPLFTTKSARNHSDVSTHIPSNLP